MIDTHDAHAPVSRTYTYKKVTKPLLERKRRARMNRCLQELKDLMVSALAAEGENVSKLEKADILELTVRHLHRLQKSSPAREEAFRFQAGFSQCAIEACNFLLNLPGVDAHVSQRLVAHLQMVVGPLSIQVPNFRLSFSPPLSPASPSSSPSPSPSRSPSQPSTSQDEKRFYKQETLFSASPSLRDLERPHTGLLMKADTRTVGNRANNNQYNRSQNEYSAEMWRPW